MKNVRESISETFVERAHAAQSSTLNYSRLVMGSIGIVPRFHGSFVKRGRKLPVVVAVGGVLGESRCFFKILRWRANCNRGNRACLDAGVCHWSFRMPEFRVWAAEWNPLLTVQGWYHWRWQPRMRDSNCSVFRRGVASSGD
jgi:hypothetical protein